MKRNVLIGIGLILLAVLVVFFATRPKTVRAPSFAVPVLSPYTEHSTYDEIVANYPTTTPLTGSANGQALSAMRSWIGGTIAAFKRDSGLTGISSSTAAELGLGNGRKYTLQITYLIASSAHTESYIYTVYEDTGGAHGNTVFKTFVFDKTSGAQLSLADVFAPGSGYLDTLSNLSRENLSKSLGQVLDAAMLDPGTEPKADNFQDFFFDNSDFVLLFPPYQVAAYAAGPQTVRIPFAKLQSVLKPNYP